MLLGQASHVHYEELCRIDVLDLSNIPANDQGNMHTEFQEQLTRDEEGWYETSMPWLISHARDYCVVHVLPWGGMGGKVRSLHGLKRLPEAPDKMLTPDLNLTKKQLAI